MGGVLSREEIRSLLCGVPPLVEGLASEQEQLQPNGFDLTVGEVALLATGGVLGASNAQRSLSQTAPLSFDGLGYIDLVPGAYLVTFAEALHLPLNVMALGFPRSSLLRCGVAIHSAVWDAGYSGRSRSLMVVYQPEGFRLQHRARLLQLVFLRLTAATAQGYQGLFQGENL